MAVSPITNGNRFAAREPEKIRERKFRANRSLRDVEPEVNLFLTDLSGQVVEDHP